MIPDALRLLGAVLTLVLCCAVIAAGLIDRWLFAWMAFAAGLALAFVAHRVCLSREEAERMREQGGFGKALRRGGVFLSRLLVAAVLIALLIALYAWGYPPASPLLVLLVGVSIVAPVLDKWAHDYALEAASADKGH